MERLKITVMAENALPEILFNDADITERVASVVITVSPKGFKVLLHLQGEPDNADSPSAILGAQFQGVIDIQTDDLPIR